MSKHPRCLVCGKRLPGRPYNDPRPGQTLWCECVTQNCPLFGLEGFAWHWRFVALQMQLVKNLEAYANALCYPPAFNVAAHHDLAAARQTLNATRAEIAKLEKGEIP